MDTGPQALTRFRHHVRRPLASTPYVWDALMYARRDKRATLAGASTAIVIEGFPRSGNTFACAAFMVSNGQHLHIGRHLHGAPHLIRAARLGVPAIALVREPRDAVLSYVIRRSHLTVTDALIEYCDFYRTAWKFRDRFVIGLFDTVTHDFGAVIDAVNERFGTEFERYDATASQVQASFALVEQMNREECGGDVVESQVGRPSAERDARRTELQSLFDDATARAHLERAKEWYERYVLAASAH